MFEAAYADLVFTISLKRSHLIRHSAEPASPNTPSSENLVNIEMIDVFGTVGQPAVDDAPCPVGPAQHAQHSLLASSRTPG
jgi:hypothetical protein